MPSFIPKFYDEGKFWPFVLKESEEDVSLKLLFDVVRNYGIAAGTIFAGRYYELHGGYLWGVFALIGLGILLTLLNALQSWVLVLKIFYHFAGFRTEEIYPRNFSTNLSSTFKVFLLMAMLIFQPVFAWMFISTVIEKAATQ